MTFALESIAFLCSSAPLFQHCMSMEMEGLLLAVFAVPLFMLILWSVKFLHWIWWKPLKLEKQLREQGIVGPQYRLLYGNLKENSKMMQEAWSKPMSLSHQVVPRVAPFLSKLVKDYGKISYMWFGPVPRVIIMDPELIKEVLSNKFGHFEKPKKTPFTKLLAMGLANYDGEKWATHRRILSPAFHVEKLKRMLPAFATSCTDLVQKWETIIGTQDSVEIDMWPEFQNLTGDVIARTAFGSNFKDGIQIFQNQTEQAELVMKAARTIYIPGSRFLPTKDNKRRAELDRKVTELLKDMIEKKEKAMQAGDSATDDLLGVMLESNKNSRDNYIGGNHNMKIGMTTKDVIEECKLFYFAGMETTSVLLTWTIVALCMHPSWQRRAREEVLQVFREKNPDFDGLNHLKVVTMILYEILRLYPPATQLFRHTYKEMKLGDIRLPPGIQLSLPTILIHHDKEFWGEDAHEFNPERFSNGISKASKHQLAFFPFGWGPRICIGQNFALVEAKLALSMILQKFSFELSPSYTHAPYVVITLHPQYGASVIMRRISA